MAQTSGTSGLTDIPVFTSPGESSEIKDLYWDLGMPAICQNSFLLSQSLMVK